MGTVCCLQRLCYSLLNDQLLLPSPPSILLNSASVVFLHWRSSHSPVKPFTSWNPQSIHIPGDLGLPPSPGLPPDRLLPLFTSNTPVAPAAPDTLTGSGPSLISLWLDAACNLPPLFFWQSLPYPRGPGTKCHFPRKPFPNPSI